MKYLFFYPERCTGCRQCALACSLSKFGTCNPKKSGITVYRDEFNRIDYPIYCLHCEEAICVRVCTSGALYSENGYVRIRRDKCIGCKLCMMMCRFAAVNFITGKAIKCDLCDGEPICVKYCSTDAIVYEEETKELAVKRKELIKQLKLL